MKYLTAREEQLACLLEADKQDLEAALHHVSAAAYHQKLAQPVRAATLLRAALFAELPADFQARVEKQLAAALDQARKQLHKTSRMTRGTISTRTEGAMGEK